MGFKDYRLTAMVRVGDSITRLLYIKTTAKLTKLQQKKFNIYKTLETCSLRQHTHRDRE